MTTQADIEHVIDQCVRFIVEVADRPLDPSTVRPYVRGTLVYLAAASDRLGCYDTVDDLIYYLTHRSLNGNPNRGSL